MHIYMIIYVCHIIVTPHDRPALKDWPFSLYLKANSPVLTSRATTLAWRQVTFETLGMGRFFRCNAWICGLIRLKMIEDVHF